MNKKTLTLLGFAAKSGNLSFGFDMTVASLKKGKAHLVVIAEDVSEKSRKEVLFFAEKSNVKHIILKGVDIETLSKSVGKKCGIISVNDEGFTKAIGGNANDQ